MDVVPSGGLSIGLITVSSGSPVRYAIGESMGKDMFSPDGFTSLQVNVPLLATSNEMTTQRKHLSASPGMGCTRSCSCSRSYSWYICTMHSDNADMTSCANRRVVLCLSFEPFFVLFSELLFLELLLCCLG